jgi:hypothetical protein
MTGAKAVQEGFAEDKGLYHVVGRESGDGGRDQGVYEGNFCKLSVQRRKAEPPANRRTVHKVHDGEVLGGEDAVESSKAKPALAVEEVGDVGLLEASVVREGEGSQASMSDTFQKKSADALLQRMEGHRRNPELV